VEGVQNRVRSGRAAMRPSLDAMGEKVYGEAKTKTFRKEDIFIEYSYVRLRDAVLPSERE